MTQTPEAPSAPHSSAPSGGERAAAIAVHLYTSIGAVLALVLLHLAYESDVQTFLWVLFAAMFIDGTDGFLARRFRVKEVVPEFDGALLDNIIDYITYVMAPALLLLANGYLPGGVWGFVVASTPVLASCVQFCRTDAKLTVGGEHYFLGFPSYWNVVVLYVVGFDMSSTVATVVLLAFAILVFVPINYIYPSRTKTMQKPTVILTALFLIAYVAIVALLPDPPLWLLWGSLGYIAYSMGLSIYLTLRSRSSATG